tara:strand:- start:32 stop:484 length:453 start_codon:yes stop_codon:yes gene_type:complete
MSQKLQLTTQLSENICQKLMQGKPLTQICKEKELPSLSVVYKWISQDKEFANKIIQARKIGCQTYLDTMIEELEHADNKNIMVVREKLHHYRWLASKLLPIYGDKQQIVQDTKIEISWQKPEKVIDSHEDAETLAQEIAQMQDSGGVKDR